MIYWPPNGAHEYIRRTDPSTHVYSYTIFSQWVAYMRETAQRRYWRLPPMAGLFICAGPELANAQRLGEQQIGKYSWTREVCNGSATWSFIGSALCIAHPPGQYCGQKRKHSTKASKMLVIRAPLNEPSRSFTCKDKAIAVLFDNAVSTLVGSAHRKRKKPQPRSVLPLSPLQHLPRLIHPRDISRSSHWSRKERSVAQHRPLTMSRQSSTVLSSCPSRVLRP